MSSKTFTPRRRRTQNKPRQRQASFEATILVKKSHVGYLIGRGGATIKALQQKHGVRSHIDQKSLVYHFSGEERRVLAAIRDVHMHIEWVNNLNKRSDETPQAKSEDGWEQAPARKPRRKVVKSKPTVVISKNPYDALDSDEESDDDSVANNRCKKFSGETPAVWTVSEPTGQWTKPLETSREEKVQFRPSIAMLRQKLAKADAAVEKAQKIHSYHESQNTGSWADEADASDALEELLDAQDYVDHLKDQIANY